MRKLIIILLICLQLVTPSLILADVGDQIKELQQKIDETQLKEKSLNTEIISMDNQIKLTALNIEKTQNDIEKLGEEINNLTDKIAQLESSLSHLLVLFSNRVVTTYKAARQSYLTLLFSANGFNDLLNRAKYIQLAQIHDQAVVVEVQNAKVEFDQQKTKREDKKKEQEDLMKKLESQKITLDSQKKAKQALLDQTKNDEATYQKLLSQAMAEKQAIEAALVSGEKVGPVKAGDAIAVMGNTGYPACSTGTHLHFEVRKNNVWIDPLGFLKSKTISDEQNGGTATVGSGSWEWPLSGDIMITQYFGKTPYSWRYTYSGGIHTGLDMYVNGSGIIYAPKDGTLYSSSEDCGGSVIKIKYIDHGDGLVTFYLHVQ